MKTHYDDRVANVNWSHGGDFESHYVPVLNTYERVPLRLDDIYGRSSAQLRQVTATPRRFGLHCTHPHARGLFFSTLINQDQQLLELKDRPATEDLGLGYGAWHAISSSLLVVLLDLSSPHHPLIIRRFVFVNEDPSDPLGRARRVVPFPTCAVYRTALLSPTLLRRKAARLARPRKPVDLELHDKLAVLIVRRARRSTCWWPAEDSSWAKDLHAHAPSRGGSSSLLPAPHDSDHQHVLAIVFLPRGLRYAQRPLGIAVGFRARGARRRDGAFLGYL
ncbi:hypothetical protein C8R45DRAFT_1091135 [Mycena sanguinolenta]|nr:hypothetical protein C8R45DRAFT_1091135 [Mycena sanguinolenta]